MRVERADGNRDAGAQAELLGPFGREMAGDLVRGRVACRASLSRTPASSGSTAVEKVFRRQAAERRVPHPFVAHGADAARDVGGIGDAAEHGRDHVAMFERGDESRALVGIVAQPVQQLRESPFGGVDAAAPIDGCESRCACAAAVISAASRQARWSHQR